MKYFLKGLKLNLEVLSVRYVFILFILLYFKLDGLVEIFELTFCLVNELSTFLKVTLGTFTSVFKDNKALRHYSTV